MAAWYKSVFEPAVEAKRIGNHPRSSNTGHKTLKPEALTIWRKTFGRFARLGVDALYVSNDIDGTDPKFAAATGTPEPNGLTPELVSGLTLRLGEYFPLIGGDLVEVAPPLAGEVEENLNARSRRRDNISVTSVNWPRASKARDKVQNRPKMSVLSSASSWKVFATSRALTWLFRSKLAR